MKVKWTPHVTPWFDAKVHKPVRVGWYETKTKWGSDVWRWYWDGEGWRWFPGGMRTITKASRWRGLTEEWK